MHPGASVDAKSGECIEANIWRRVPMQDLLPEPGSAEERVWYAAQKAAKANNN